MLRRLAWLAFPALIVAAIALVAKIRSAPSRPPAPATSPTEATRTGADEATVRRVVSARNRAAAAERDAFAADGWEMVDSTPPDPRLLALDPALLAGREEDLRTQLASTTPRRSDVGNLAAVARRAQRAETRVSAVDALGRLRDDAAQGALIDLLHDLAPGDPARAEIPARLRAPALDDPHAARLARLLDDHALTPGERQQIAFSLALVGLRDGTTLDDRLLASLSAPARGQYASMIDLARGARPPLHPHGDHHP